MKLHCMICSLQGTHISADSEIATIPEGTLGLPLRPEMFTSISPERGIPAPWRAGTDWQTMKCPRGNHLPWGIEYDETEQAIKNGGPAQILTDKGVIDVQQKHGFVCNKCGRKVKNMAGLLSHQRCCKGVNNA